MGMRPLWWTMDGLGLWTTRRGLPLQARARKNERLKDNDWLGRVGIVLQLQRDAIS